MSQKAPSPPSLLRRPQAPPAESPPWSAAFKNSSMSSLDYPLTTMARAAVFASNGLSLTHNSPGRGTSLLLMIPLIKGGFSADLFSSSACLLSKCSSPLVKAFLPVSPKYSATPLFELKWGFWIWILNFFEFFLNWIFVPTGWTSKTEEKQFFLSYLKSSNVLFSEFDAFYRSMEEANSLTKQVGLLWLSCQKVLSMSIAKLSAVNNPLSMFSLTAILATATTSKSSALTAQVTSIMSQQHQQLVS